MKKEWKAGRIDSLLLEDRMLGVTGAHQACNSLEGLEILLKENNINEDSTVVEIGSFGGVSSELFALKCKKVYCIDPWTRLFDGDDEINLEAREKYPEKNADKQVVEKLENGLTWKENVEWAEKTFDARMFVYNNVVKVKDFSHHACSRIENESVDMVYVDGIHDFAGVRADILNYYPKLKVGGVLAGHDYYCRGVRRCVIYLGEHYLETRKKYKDSSWSFIKKADVNIEIPETYRDACK